MSSEKHEYNILPKAGSSLGRKHSDETKQIISDAMVGNTNKKGKKALLAMKRPLFFFNKLKKKGPIFNKNI